MKTQAAVLFGQKEPLRIVELDIPDPKEGQVLVEVLYSGICGTQVNEIMGLKGEDKWIPHCLGHEGVGKVLNVGPGVSKVQAGDMVVMTWLKGEGLEAGGAQYTSGDLTINSGPVHTFQRHALISENRLVPLSDGVDHKSAVLLGCALPTGVGSVFNVLKVRAQESVCVFGCGGIGLSSIGAAKSVGCSTIVAVDPVEKRRELALESGATLALDPTADNFSEQLNSAKGQGFDCAVEASGLVDVMGLALQSVRPRGGRCVVIGNSKKGDMLSIDPVQFNMGKNLLGSWGGECVPDEDIPQYAQLIRNGDVQVDHLLSNTYALDDINEAVRDLMAGSIGRPIIDMKL
ncbi:zinc-binding dehydrogenase [Terasakiella pusilla]|uniref:zinc-binding dehydrogenase n=1 Tax=Terasakiella pusilla TaxID=64973 RepID=UPI003AA7CD35